MGASTWSLLPYTYTVHELLATDCTDYFLAPPVYLDVYGRPTKVLYYNMLFPYVL